MGKTYVVLDSFSPLWQCYLDDCGADQIKCHGRAGHVTAVHDDKLLVYGGYNSRHNALGDLIEVNTVDFSCRVIKCDGVMYNRERRWHTACLLGNRWIIHGGWNGNGVLGNVMSLSLGALLGSKCHPWEFL